MKIYTAKELYQREPEKTTNGPCYFQSFYGGHIDEFRGEELIETKRIEFKILKNHCFDGRRIWTLATVWFDNHPIMIIQNAGREGDDHIERYITDKKRFNLMIDHLHELSPPLLFPPFGAEIEEISDSEPIEGLSYFYGNHLDGEFECY